MILPKNILFLLNRPLSRIFPVAMASLFFTGASCAPSGSQQKDSVAVQETVTDADSEARGEELTGILRDISEGNAAAFAARCAYPIARAYPLRDIPDAGQMTVYFPLMFDESVRAMLKDRDASFWQPAGWRGWSAGDDNWLWWDGKVYAINYTSAAEDALRASLTLEEMGSLPPAMREGWMPAFCLIGEKEDTIYRVDFRPLQPTTEGRIHTVDVENDISVPDTTLFRLAVYPPDADLSMMPPLILTGHRHVEGSAGSRIYHFSDTIGTTAEYTPDGEDTIPTIIITDGRHHAVKHRVKRAYWRDYARRHPRPAR